MILRKYLLHIYALLFACLLITSCGSAEKSVRRGDAALALGEYAEAAGQYKRAYSQTSPKEKAQRGRIAYKMADAYRKYGNTSRAVAAYQNAVRYHYTDTLTHYYLGEMLRMQGNYKAATNAYKAYLDSFPGDANAERGLEACLMAPAEKRKALPIR